MPWKQISKKKFIMYVPWQSYRIFCDCNIYTHWPKIIAKVITSFITSPTMVLITNAHDIDVQLVLNSIVNITKSSNMKGWCILLLAIYLILYGSFCVITPHLYPHMLRFNATHKKPPQESSLRQTSSGKQCQGYWSGSDWKTNSYSNPQLTANSRTSRNNDKDVCPNLRSLTLRKACLWS